VREDALNVLARSSHCTTAFDLHIYPMAARAAGSWAASRYAGDGGWLMGIGPGVLTPRSRGTVRITDPDPEALPRIDHAYFTDPDGLDLAVLLDGVEIARSILAQPPLDRLLGAESAPGIDVRDRSALGDFVRAHSSHAYHPAGSCMMGPASDPLAVVDARGRVHGLDGLYVADASIMPTVPRANTNVPTLVIGEKIASLLLEDDAGR
jgi:choline dehydrogenase